MSSAVGVLALICLLRILLRIWTRLFDSQSQRAVDQLLSAKEPTVAEFLSGLSAVSVCGWFLFVLAEFLSWQPEFWKLLKAFLLLCFVLFWFLVRNAFLFQNSHAFQGLHSACRRCARHPKRKQSPHCLVGPGCLLLVSMSSLSPSKAVTGLGCSVGPCSRAEHTSPDSSYSGQGADSAVDKLRQPNNKHKWIVNTFFERTSERQNGEWRVCLINHFEKTGYSYKEV